jgi:hypothetical protein
VSAFNEYVRRGGTVMAVGPCFTRDEYGRNRKVGLVASGRGRLVTFRDPLTARAYRDTLDRLLDETGVARPVRLEGSQGEPIWGVCVRAVEADGGLLVNVLNLSRETRQVRLVSGPASNHAVNLMDGREIEFPLSLPPLEPILLALRPN